jgi:ParB/RepB/Spo0J family partition protein
MPRELTPEEIKRRFTAKSPAGKPAEPINPIPPPAMGPIMEAASQPAVVGRPPDLGNPPTPSGQWQLVERDQLIPREDNPRRIDVKADSFLALVASICSAGIVTPLLGRPHPQLPGKVELLAGHRRRMAGMEAGLAEFPVIVREMDDRTALEVLVFENLDRENLTPLEEARGVQLMLSSGHSAQEIADRMGKTRGWVARRANLLNLTKQWQEWAEEKNVGAEHLELIARYPAERQEDLFGRLGNFSHEVEELFMGRGSLAALRERLAEEMGDLLHAPWSLDDATLDAKAGACALCPKRSGCQPDLFTEEAEGGDFCLDRDCWRGKMEAFKEVREAVLRKEHPGLVRVIGKNGSSWGPGGKRIAGLETYQYDKCTQKSKGAVPALVVSGDGEGTLIWVKEKAGSKEPVPKLQTAAARQAEASQDPKACEEILREKREGLEQRRTAWVIQRLLELLAEAERPAAAFDNAEAYLAMVAGFGTTDLRIGEEAGEDVPEPWETPASGGLVSRRAVWEMLKPRIRQEIFFYNNAGICDEHRKGCRWIASLLGANLDVLKEEAEKEIKEPKSWEQLKKLAEAPAKEAKKEPSSKKKGKAA